MARIAIATLQNGWDCRWIRPDHDTGPGSLAGEPAVCERTGGHRRVSLAECERCVHWELAPDAPQQVAANAAAAGAAARAEVAAGPAPAAPATAARHDLLLLTEPPSLAARGLYFATWGAIVATAATLVACGLAVLTTPLAIPVTVGLFLGAAALVGFACTGQLPRP